MLFKDLSTELEELDERYGMSNILLVLSDICLDKAIRIAHKDAEAEKRWRTLGIQLEQLNYHQLDQTD